MLLSKNGCGKEADNWEERWQKHPAMVTFAARSGVEGSK